MKIRSAALTQASWRSTINAFFKEYLLRGVLLGYQWQISALFERRHCVLSQLEWLVEYVSLSIQSL